MHFSPCSIAMGRSRGFFRFLISCSIAAILPLNLPAQTAELSPIESQFLAPLMAEFNRPPDPSHPETSQRASVRYELVSRTDSGRPAEVLAESRNGFVGYKLQIARSAANQPLSYLREITALSALTDPDAGSRVIEMAETLTNMKEGSLAARFAWETHVLTWLKGRRPSGTVMALLHQWTPVSEQEIERTLFDERERLEKELLPELRKRLIKDQARKSREWDRLNSEKLKSLEQRELKLNDLIVRNDRAGVRRLIEAYLPWSLMEPVEQKMWRNWLEAIEFPDPSKKTVVFRGVDYSTDFMQTLKTPEGIKIGFMSTLLTKNQGNYTRRLRSLKTKRLETGDEFAKHWGTPPHVKISEQMRAHAIDPIGSAFLSFTLDPAVITSFIGSPRYDRMGQERAGGGFLAVAIDSRRVFPNLRNGVAAELEYLAPLVVFPDEIVEYREVSVSGYTEVHAAHREFLDSIRKKAGNIFKTNPMKDPAAVAEYQRVGKSFVTDFFAENPGRSCRHVWN